MHRAPLAIALTFALVACDDETSSAIGSQLYAPDEVAVNWDEEFDARADGLGAMVPVDLMVYEGLTGEPLEDVVIELNALTSGIELVPADAVEVVTGACDACVWDAMRDRYVDWAETASDTATDADGLARIYVWVDQLPENDEPAFEVALDDTVHFVDVLQD